MEKLPLMSVIVPIPDLPFTLTLTPMRGSPDASFTVPFTRVFFVCEVLNMLACPALMSGARINKEASLEGNATAGVKTEKQKFILSTSHTLF